MLTLLYTPWDAGVLSLVFPRLLIVPVQHYRQVPGVLWEYLPSGANFGHTCRLCQGVRRTLSLPPTPTDLKKKKPKNRNCLNLTRSTSFVQKLLRFLTVVHRESGSPFHSLFPCNMQFAKNHSFRQPASSAELKSDILPIREIAEITDSYTRRNWSG